MAPTEKKKRGPEPARIEVGKVRNRRDRPFPVFGSFNFSSVSHNRSAQADHKIGQITRPTNKKGKKIVDRRDAAGPAGPTAVPSGVLRRSFPSVSSTLRRGP